MGEGAGEWTGRIWYEVRYQETPDCDPFEKFHYVMRSWGEVEEAEKVAARLSAQGCYSEIILCTPMRGIPGVRGEK